MSVNLLAQNFTNGDLEGVINGFSTLPPSWEVVNYADINCQASADGTTPDLVNTTQPATLYGMMGTPYSGNTFVAGSYGISADSGTFFQEGIQQLVTGFSVGQMYKVSFFQAVVKTSQSLDISGSWRVIMDNTIIGTTEPTVSLNAFNSLTFPWELRSITFTATASAHVFKFLPRDDDEDLLSSPTNTQGALYMGIDFINLEPTLGIEKKDLLEAITLFPNPTAAYLVINIKEGISDRKVAIYSSTGTKLEERNLDFPTSQMDLSTYANGVYFLHFKADAGEVTKVVVVQH